MENLNYTAANLTKIFGIPPATAITLVGDQKKIGDYVYGPIKNPSLGNGHGEGYKYRGAGFNQLTGKANYKKYGTLVGVDLVSNPEKINDVKVASDVVIEFFKNGITSLKNLGKLSQYNATNINDFKSAKDSLDAIYHINAGTGSTKAKLDADVTGGRAKARERLNDIVGFVNNISGVIKNNLGKTIGITLLLGSVLFGIIYFANK
ncbi:MAG: hypothetical protein AABY22_20975 [Nanoarchaeota archaeon]